MKLISAKVSEENRFVLAAFLFFGMGHANAIKQRIALSIAVTDVITFFCIALPAD